MKRLPSIDPTKLLPVTSSISLPFEYEQKLREEMRRTGLDKSKLIRAILDMYFEQPIK